MSVETPSLEQPIDQPGDLVSIPELEPGAELRVATPEDTNFLRKMAFAAGDSSGQGRNIDARCY
ncbi:MAG TPA: hypothetical protein VK694_01445 [Verrucomicrobiae bacterium]|nr:hypothetical protein [Verrucomicrobiae bacterium]